MRLRSRWKSQFDDAIRSGRSLQAPISIAQIGKFSSVLPFDSNIVASVRKSERQSQVSAGGKSGTPPSMSNLDAFLEILDYFDERYWEISGRRKILCIVHREKRDGIGMLRSGECVKKIDDKVITPRGV